MNIPLSGSLGPVGRPQQQRGPGRTHIRQNTARRGPARMTAMMADARKTPTRFDRVGYSRSAEQMGHANAPPGNCVTT